MPDQEISVSTLGEVLGRDLAALKRSAIEHLTIPENAGSVASDAALETLLDRLCLSLALSKPIGLATWAEREVQRVGRAEASDMLAAAAHAISVHAGSFAIERARVLAPLERLCAEVRRTALGGPEPTAAPEVDRAADVLMAMLAERDAATSARSKATAVWARRLATALKRERENVEFIELCGLLHDVGKVGTPDGILHKPGPLTPQEWSVMRDHAAAGERILAQIPTLRACALVVRAHHERYDGAGYPDGLRGEAIPIEARILAVADSFSSMVSESPYRKAISPRQALKILDDGKGTAWDPLVVEAFTGLFEHRTSSVRSSLTQTR
ncbi:MAG: HD-GYP domain-containing protein [Candidatus Tyrphobacter sp.]